MRETPRYARNLSDAFYMSKGLVGLLDLTKESLCLEWCEVRSGSSFAVENVIGRLSRTPAEENKKTN